MFSPISPSKHIYADIQGRVKSPHEYAEIDDLLKRNSAAYQQLLEGEQDTASTGYAKLDSSTMPRGSQPHIYSQPMSPSVQTANTTEPSSGPHYFELEKQSSPKYFELEKQSSQETSRNSETSEQKSPKYFELEKAVSTKESQNNNQCTSPGDFQFDDVELDEITV